MRFLVPVLAVLAAAPAHAQHYPNYEAGPNGTGGTIGTVGRRNFETDDRQGMSGQIGGRRLGVIEERPALTPGNVGATQGNCLVDGNGNAYCR